jgi:hypothetical protein
VRSKITHREWLAVAGFQPSARDNGMTKGCNGNGRFSSRRIARQRLGELPTGA